MKQQISFKERFREFRQNVSWFIESRVIPNWLSSLILLIKIWIIFLILRARFNKTDRAYELDLKYTPFGGCHPWAILIEDHIDTGSKTAGWYGIGSRTKIREFVKFITDTLEEEELEVLVEIEEGGVKVDNCRVEYRNYDIVLIDIDCVTKYAGYMGGVSFDKKVTTPSISLYVTADTIKYNEEKKDQATNIHFTGLKGFELFSISGGRYNVYATLRRIEI